MNNFKPSPRHNLYNEDLKPKSGKEKHITPAGYGVIWFGTAVQLSSFVSLSPMVEYFTIAQFILVLLIGNIMLGFLTFIAQDIGIKYGISFATSISSTFGYVGGKIVNLIRILPSLFFFGLAAYVGAVALNEIFKMVFNFENLFISLIINVILTVSITLKKLKIIEKVLLFIAPILVLVSFYMLYVVLSHYNVSFIDALSMGNLNNQSVPISLWIFGLAATAGGFTSVALGMNDFTAECKNISKSNKWFPNNFKYSMMALIGLVPAYTFVGLVGAVTIVLSGRTDALVVISELVQERSIALAILLQLFVILAQMATNAPANLMPSAYAVSSLMPKVISYKLALFIFSALSLFIVPLAIGGYANFILSLFSATIGPAIAILGVDYYLFRKRNLDIDQLYDSTGKYKYFKGINLTALLVYLVTSVVGLLLDNISFFVATISAAVLYYFIGNVVEKKYPGTLTEEKTQYKISS
jgi:nucleobase:cation symporter-1, NCS1 family